MLGKLFKHDMRQISKVMLPFMILIFGTTILGTAALKFANEISYFHTSYYVKNTLNSPLYLIFVFSIVALSAYAILAVFLSVSRYYKNFFSDEGFLTFTLPVKSSTLIFSKLWSTLIWIFISSAVVTACILIYVTFGGAPIGKFINVDFYEEFVGVVWQDLKILFSSLDVSGVFMIVEAIALGLAAMIYGILSLFLAITIGSIIAKKHKILASIGFYYLINTAVSTVIMTVTIMLIPQTVGISSGRSFEIFMHVYLLSILLVYAVVMVADFLIIDYLLKKKLNLQ